MRRWLGRLRPRALARSFRTAAAAFEHEWLAYDHILVDEATLKDVRSLVRRHPLRGFDAIHLSAALWLRAELGRPIEFWASDQRLEAAAETGALHRSESRGRQLRVSGVSHAGRDQSHQFRAGREPGVAGAPAELGEALGYHLLMISDHVAITPDVQARYPAPLYDPFMTLAWLAGLTRRVELGTTVIILPYRHPLQTARMAANVDRLSGGRFILGIGVGWARQEFDALGVPFHGGAP